MSCKHCEGTPMTTVCGHCDRATRYVVRANPGSEHKWQPDPKSLVEKLLDFIEAQEWAGKQVVYPSTDFGGMVVTDLCLDCGAEKGQPHSTDCWWLACMKQGGRR